MLPSESVITGAFSHPLQRADEHSAAPTPRRRNPFPAWSVIDDPKKSADSLAKEATREFNLASEKVQAKTGHIDPWTPKYYAACTVGGLLACVSSLSSKLLINLGTNCSHSVRVLLIQQ